MTETPRTLLGLTSDAKPIVEFQRPGYSLMIAPTDAGRTICGAIPWFLAIGSVDNPFAKAGMIDE